jgi:hypothetical protein
VLLALGGCGRFKFDPLAIGTGDSGQGADTNSLDACSPWSTPQLVPTVNSSSQDYEPELSPDGGWLVFVSTRGGANEDLYLSQVTGGIFGTPQAVTSLNTSGVDDGPTWDPSDADLYFAIDTKLYTATFSGGGFGPKTLVPELATASILGTAIAPSGLELYFHIHSGMTNTMWRSVRATPTSPWQTPAPIPELASVNGGFPTLSADGKTMYFEGTAPSGNSQLYVVTRPAVGAAFGTPTIFTELASANSNDGDPFLSYDGQTFLFSSTRSGGPGGYDLFVSTRTCQ